MSDARPLLARAPCSVDDPLRVGVLVSGSGSNLQALLDATKVVGTSFAVRLVVSNEPEAYALTRARDAGVPIAVHSHRGRSRVELEEAILHEMHAHRVEVVVLAGFMRILTSTFIDQWPSSIINVHPALCPAFPGMHAAKQALDHGARVTGCTVHLVDAGVDTGPILAQAAVGIEDDDDEASLQERIQTAEHALLPRVLQSLALGRVVTTNGRVRARKLAHFPHHAS